MTPTTILESLGEKAGGDPVVPVDVEFHDSIRMEIFLDKENAERSMANHGVLYPDWQDFVRHTATDVAKILDLRLIGPDGSVGDNGTTGGRAVRLGTVSAFASQPVNYHPRDRRIAEAVAASLDALRQVERSRIHVWPTDLHGRPMASISDAESRRAKFTDGAIVTELMRSCLSADPPAIVVVVSGDADFIPTLKAIRQERPEIQILVAAFSDALSGDYRSGDRVGVEWQYPPVLLDDWLAGQRKGPLAKQTWNKVSSQEKGISHMSSETEQSFDAGRQKRNGGWSGATDLQIGRMAVNWAMYGRLDVYVKKASGRIGASVICDEDGGKYAVTTGVLARFPEVGSFSGWAWIDRARMLAFRFDTGDEASRPAPMLSVESAGCRVEVDSRCCAGPAPEHGALVAFRDRVVGSTARGMLRRRVTQIIPLDRQHVLVIANLIGAGQLAFPEHVEVLPVFFDGLADQSQSVAHNRSLVDSALDRLAAHPGVPADFQMLARVERRRKFTSGDDGAGALVPRNFGGPRGTPGIDSAAKKISDPAAEPVTTGDVVQVKLQLD